MAREKPIKSPSTPGQDEATPRIDKETADNYVRGLLARGEAARAQNGKLPAGATHEIVDEPEAQNGKLPAGATHEIVDEPEGELPRVKRRRFSAF